MNSPTPLLDEQPLEYEIDPQVQDDLANYAGQWVAITRSQVVASGESAKEVFDKAKEARIEHPIVFRVPSNRHAVYFF